MDMQKKDKAVCAVFGMFLGAGFLLCLFLPEETYSMAERRRLAPAPELTGEAVWNGRFMDNFETYAADAFPFRQKFRQIKAAVSAGVFLRQDNNGIYASGEYLSALEYPMDLASLDYAAERFSYVKEKYLTKENRVFLAVIPDKNCFLAKESMRPSMDYGEFERQMAQRVDFAESISLLGLLEKEDYYQTDTHWRQEKITDVAELLAERMGASLSEDYEVHTLEEDFYGVYYGQAALPHKPEKLRYLTGEAIDHCRVYDWQNGREIPVYNLEAVRRDPYEMFLSGSLSLITIENKMAGEDKRLVMFRDSFGSSIAPLLASGYSQITLADIRYIHPDHLGQFVDFKDCDVLFLYSTLVLNNSETLK